MGGKVGSIKPRNGRKFVGCDRALMVDGKLRRTVNSHRHVISAIKIDGQSGAVLPWHSRRGHRLIRPERNNQIDTNFANRPRWPSQVRLRLYWFCTLSQRRSRVLILKQAFRVHRVVVIDAILGTKVVVAHPDGVNGRWIQGTPHSDLCGAHDQTFHLP